jgi:hypothetical protein
VSIRVEAMKGSQAVLVLTRQPTVPTDCEKRREEATSKDKEGSFRRAVTFKMSLMLQETWVRFGTNGIGISDHQNRYSSGVLVGNYVENEFGNQQQVRTRRSRAQQMKPDGRMEPCLAAAPGRFLLSLPPVADFQPFFSRGWICVF